MLHAKPGSGEVSFLDDVKSHEESSGSLHVHSKDIKTYKNDEFYVNLCCRFNVCFNRNYNRFCQ